MIEDLKRDFRALEDSFLILESRRNEELKEVEELESKARDLTKAIETCSKAIEFVEKVSTEERQSIKEKVESLVSSCLKSVFDDSYSVEFDYSMKRSRTSVEVYAIRSCDDGMKVRRQIDGIGGGVADAMSLPLKLIVLMNDDGLDNVLILDEPGKFLSLNHVPQFASFVRTISKSLGVQIIMVSHHQCMGQYADSVQEVSIEGSRSSMSRAR